MSAVRLTSPKAPLGARRSPKWPALRCRFLKGKVCAVCGGKKKLEAHHMRPFHTHPELELDETNLVPLCEGNGVNCHLLFGHLGSYRSINPDVLEDAAQWRRKLMLRRQT